ncbi:class I SAM-dependent methyltransferase [Candidatus Poribacteria bacterium]|nr:class I SAM-dependent methyltransferase [Candidatus Poribacteria bacterium]
MQYLFGDSDAAAQRLKLVADVFAGTTRSFVLDTVIEKPDILADLGCGPGHTTRLLAETLRCARTIGLDNSEHFLSLARQSAQGGVSFLFHDVSSVPFPMEQGDLLYCRFLLSHLKHPRALLSRWMTQLKQGGLLLIEEVEWIHTQNDDFALYLSIVEAMLQDQSAELYVGRELDRLRDSETMGRRISQVGRLRVSYDDAATMFCLNMQTWKHQPFVRSNYSFSAITKLEDALRTLSMKKSGKSEIEWGLRQIVFERI